MSIFSNLKSYAGKWSVKSCRGFDQDEISEIKSWHPIEGDYGTSICFLLTSGEEKYIQVSRDADLDKLGDVTLDKMSLVTLERGNEETLRVEF